VPELPQDSPYEERVCQAIAARLAEIDGLQQSAYMLGNATAPTAEILPGVIEFDESFARGFDRYEAVVRVTVGQSMDIGAQIRLRQFRSPDGPKSIKRVVECDPETGERERTLGGLTSDLNVNRVSPVRNFRRPDGTVVLGCDFEIEYEGSGREQ